MTGFRDVTADRRYEQGFTAPGGEEGVVFADYADQGGARLILHVEAEDQLRGTGAAGRFMQSLADHARAEKTTLAPRCSYAVAWFRRHPDYQDILA